MRGLRNIYNLGVKELLSGADRCLYDFGLPFVTVLPGSLHLPLSPSPIWISRSCRTVLRIVLPPVVSPPEMITATEMDAGLDAGRYTFAVNIPPNFQRDVLAGRQPDIIQVNVDATRMSQAFTGNSYIQNIISGEVNSFVARARGEGAFSRCRAGDWMRFNPNRYPAVWRRDGGLTLSTT